MHKRGFAIVGAAKGKGSVEDGINFLKGYDIVAHPRCHALIDELIHYSWAVDRHTGEFLSRLAEKRVSIIDPLTLIRRCQSKGRSYQIGAVAARLICAECGLREVRLSTAFGD